MSADINVWSSTQRIVVDMPARFVAVSMAGPPGPQGPPGVGLDVSGSDTFANITAIQNPTPGDLWIQTDGGGGGSPGDGIVWDGVSWVNLGPIQGPPGADGVDGADGATGPQGPQGPAGTNGVGVPSGGATGTFLTKATAANYDTAWVDASGIFLPLSGGSMSGDIEMTGVGRQVRFMNGGGPHGIEVFQADVLEGALYYRTTPQSWNFENASGQEILEITQTIARACGTTNECFVVGGPNGPTRPFLSFREENDTRVMYIGYPDANNNVIIRADIGHLNLEATAGSIRSSTIYDDTANDWGVFIEADGTLGRTASTLRVKTNVEELTVEEASGILDLITWVRFNYLDKDTGEAKDTLQFGAIAEWMEEAGLGEFVGYDDEGLPNAVRYNALWPLVARVQQAHEERLTQLEQRLDALGG